MAKDPSGDRAGARTSTQRCTPHKQNHIGSSRQLIKSSCQGAPFVVFEGANQTTTVLLSGGERFASESLTAVEWICCARASPQRLARRPNLRTCALEELPGSSRFRATGSLGFARDFGSGLTRPLNSSTSTLQNHSRASDSASLRMTRNCVCE